MSDQVQEVHHEVYMLLIYQHNTSLVYCLQAQAQHLVLFEDLIMTEQHLILHVARESSVHLS